MALRKGGLHNRDEDWQSKEKAVCWEGLSFPEALLADKQSLVYSNLGHGSVKDRREEAYTQVSQKHSLEMVL